MERCPHCRQLILTHVWVDATAAKKVGKTVITEAIPGHWRPLDVPQTAVFGTTHRCPAVTREGQAA